MYTYNGTTAHYYTYNAVFGVSPRNVISKAFIYIYIFRLSRRNAVGIIIFIETAAVRSGGGIDWTDEAKKNVIRRRFVLSSVVYSLDGGEGKKIVRALV